MQLHEKSHPSAFSRPCQGAAAISTDSPSLSLTGGHSTAAVMALGKLFFLWLSHPLQREWREASILVEMEGASGGMMAVEKNGKPSRSWELWKEYKFWPAFSSLAGFHGDIISHGVCFEMCSPFMCCLLKCQVAGEPPTTPSEAGPCRTCLCAHLFMKL